MDHCSDPHIFARLVSPGPLRRALRRPLRRALRRLSLQRWRHVGQFDTSALWGASRRASVNGANGRSGAWLQFKLLHSAAQHHDSAFKAIGAGVAELEIVATLQLQVAVSIASRPDGGDADGIVEEQQPFGRTGRARRRYRRFARLQAIPPQPSQRREENKQQQLGHEYPL